MVPIVLQDQTPTARGLNIGKIRQRDICRFCGDSNPYFAGEGSALLPYPVYKYLREERIVLESTLT